MRAPTAPEWNSRVVLISSRASYEMVQKAASCGVEVLLAVSAATGFAVETAEKAGLTLAAFCRPGRATVLTHPERLTNAGLPAQRGVVIDSVAERTFRRPAEESVS